MSSLIRIHHFAEAANHASRMQYLTADSTSLAVNATNLPTSSFSKEEQQINKLTWKIFRQSMIDSLGQQKFDWICSRYRNSLNFTRMESSGLPLLPKHVEIFSIGSSQITAGRDIALRMGNMTCAQVREAVQRAQPLGVVGTYIDPFEIHGAPCTFAAQIMHDKLLMDKEKQLLFSDTQNLNFPAWLERMAKVTVNRELLEGQLIPTPGANGQLDYYKVYRKITTGDGLMAYALKPIATDSRLKPLLLFRPSQWAISNEDAFETYLNNVQPQLGERGWQAAADARLFEHLMQDPEFRSLDEKILIAGYSLGGAHAQYFLANFHEHVSNAIFYANPSVDAQTAEKFAETMRTLPPRSEPLYIQIFRMEKEFCHCVGEKHVGWGVNRPDVHIQLIYTDHNNEMISVFGLHAHRIFDNANFPYGMRGVENAEELFNHLDNSKRGMDIYWYEQTRQLWGHIAYATFSFIYQAIQWFSWIFGIKILRSSKYPEL